MWADDPETSKSWLGPRSHLDPQPPGWNSCSIERIGGLCQAEHLLEIRTDAGRHIGQQPIPRSRPGHRLHRRFQTEGRR